jgi:signal transduction histidine kinase
MSGKLLSFVNRMKLAQKALILIAVPLVFELALVGTLLYLQNQTELEVARESHARQITDVTNRIILHLETMNSVFLTPNTTNPLVEALGHPGTELTKDLDELQTLLSSDRKARIEALKADSNPQAQLNEIKQAYREVRPLFLNNPGLAKVKVNEFLDGMKDRLFKHVLVLGRIIKEEQAVTSESPRIQAQLRHNVHNLLIFAIPFNIGLAAILAWYFNKTTTERLRKIVRDTEALAANESLTQPIPGSDEIAILDRAFYETVGERRRIDEMKQEFVNMVSHDLRTPLTSLKAVFGMFADDTYGEITADGKTILNQASANVSRLIRLIADLLDFEQMESGELKMDRQLLGAEELVQPAIDALDGFAEQQGIKIEFTPSESVDCLEADRERMGQVLTNLISNAIKFSPKQGTISITSNVDAATHEIVLSVHDDGPGVPQSEQKLIFEKFRQGSTQSERQRGSGLGLAICRHIVELHGGTIGVESSQGTGSRFWVRLPLASTQKPVVMSS